MPGVVVSTAVRTGPSAATVRESSQLFVVGLAERGPTDEAILVQSLADFEFNFGGYISSSYLHPTVEAFFEEGGTQCYVSRVVGAGATTGTLELDNSASVAVLTIDADGPGAWSSDVDVIVETVSAGVSFRVKINYDGALVYSTGTVTSVAQAAGRINTSPLASRYVIATATEGATTLPVAGTFTLSAGDSAHATATPTSHAAVYVTGLEKFNDALGTGAVCVPDAEGGTAVGTFTISEALIAHANTYNRIAILHAGKADTSTYAKTKAAQLQAEDGSEHAALYFPWIDVPTSITGVSRRIPPDGYVAAKRALAHNQTGPHVPAAGLVSAALYAIGTAVDIDKTTGDDLDVNFVNAIRIIQNTIRIYGARSLSADEDNFRFITSQDVVNTVVTEAYRSLEDLVFTAIDGRQTVYASISSRLTAICARLAEDGALFASYGVNGAEIDPGYTVRCDSSLNPVAQLAGGTIKAKVGLRASSVGDKIEVDITKSSLTSSVTQ